jgi:hypothetical protein
MLRSTLVSMVALMLVACGTQNQNPLAPQASPTPSPAQASPVLPAAMQQAPQAGQHTLYIASNERVPDCTLDAEGWLIYVEADQSFEVCVNTVWTAINLRGPQGETGAQGVKGDQGAQGGEGIAGAQGDKGDKGDKGDAGSTFWTDSTSAVGASWLDPDTGKTWQIVGNSLAYASATCPVDYSLPTGTLPFKFVNYFIEYVSLLPTSAAYWTSVVSPSGHYSRTITSNGTTTVDSLDTDANVTICVSN